MGAERRQRAGTSWEDEGYGCRHRLSWAHDDDAAAGLHGSSLCHSSSVMKGMTGDSSVSATDTQWKSTLSCGASHDPWSSPC